MKPLIYISLFLTFIGLGGLHVIAQTNLLLNPNADLGMENWRANGNAAIEQFDGKNVFVVRDGDNGTTSGFSQDVNLTAADAGKYALLIGQGSSERINADGAIELIRLHA